MISHAQMGQILCLGVVIQPRENCHDLLEMGENMPGNRLDANVGGKYLKKACPKVDKLAIFYHYLSIP